MNPRNRLIMVSNRLPISVERTALLVNPYDVTGVTTAIHDALFVSNKERRRRMKQLRRSVREYDVRRWTDSFLDAAGIELTPKIEVQDGVLRGAVPSSSRIGARARLIRNLVRGKVTAGIQTAAMSLLKGSYR